MSGVGLGRGRGRGVFRADDDTTAAAKPGSGGAGDTVSTGKPLVYGPLSGVSVHGN